MNEKIYVVMYSMGRYEDYTEKSIFATRDKKKADDYVLKFNSIAEKWYEHYDVNGCIDDGIIQEIFFYSDLGCAFIMEVDIRN